MRGFQATVNMVNVDGNLTADPVQVLDTGRKYSQGILNVSDSPSENSHILPFYKGYTIFITAYYGRS